MSGQEQQQQENSYNGRPSHSGFAITILYFLLLIFGPMISIPVTLGVITLLFFWLLWSTLSKSQYEQMQKTYPDYPRADYIINGLIFHVFGPPLFIVLFYIVAVSISRLTS